MWFLMISKPKARYLEGDKVIPLIIIWHILKTELSFKEISLGEKMTNITKKEKEFMKSKAKTTKVSKKRTRETC